MEEMNNLPNIQDNKNKDLNFHGKNKSTNCNDIIQQFKTDYELQGMTPESVYYTVGEVRRFCDFIKKNPAEATKKDILAYLVSLREREIKHTSLKRQFSALAVFYDFLEELELIDKNLIRPIRKKYLYQYKEPRSERRAITIEEAAHLVNSIMDTRDRAIVIILLKTGIRRKELLAMDVSDVNLQEMSITLKPTAKRSNRIVFFDEEARELLKRWLRTREVWPHENGALWITRQGERLRGNYIQRRIEMHAERAGLHDPSSDDPQKRFTPHYTRHTFTTWMRKAGMPREFIQELRGDSIKEAIDIYDHIDKEELRESYLSHIPRIGV